MDRAHPKPQVLERFLDVVPAFARLPLPGRGDTWERFEILASLAEEDLSLARLGEGHADALAILEESGSSRHSEASYGVWAARSGAGGVTATPVVGGWKLAGRKPFCSGSGMVDRALVTAEAPDGYRLFDVDTAEVVVDAIPDSWPAVGMADSLSETLIFGGPVVTEDDAVGRPASTPIGLASGSAPVGWPACWFGGARGLVAGVVGRLGSDPGEVVLMEIGKAAGSLQAMGDALKSVATAIDADPEDKLEHARPRAMAVRQIVHDFSGAILRQTAAAGGARPLCHDAGPGPTGRRPLRLSGPAPWRGRCSEPGSFGLRRATDGADRRSHEHPCVSDRVQPRGAATKALGKSTAGYSCGSRTDGLDEADLFQRDVQRWILTRGSSSRAGTSGESTH